MGLTAKKVALQVLCVEVSLGAVRAREFAICILDRNHSALRSSSGSRGSRTARGAGQDTAAALRSDYVSRLLRVLEDRVGLHE